MSRKCFGGVRLIKFECGLARAGISFYEMVKLIGLYKDIGDYEKLRKEVFAENYLGKNSDSRTGDILKAFKKRFLTTDNIMKLPAVKI